MITSTKNLRALPALCATTLLLSAGCQSSRSMGPLWYERYAQQTAQQTPAQQSISPQTIEAPYEEATALYAPEADITASVTAAPASPPAMSRQAREAQALARSYQAPAKAAPSSAPLTERQQTRLQRRMDRLTSMMPSQALATQKSQAVGKILTVILVIIGSAIIITLLIILAVARAFS